MRVLSFLFLSAFCLSVCVSTSADSGKLLSEIAMKSQGIPYVGGTLEGEPETFRVDTSRTDCILFVEQCVAKALTESHLRIDTEEMKLQYAKDTAGLFLNNVKCLRYKRGQVSYVTREHYTSGWLAQAEEYGVLKELTPEFGVPLKQEFSFMSCHPDLYPALSTHPERIVEIRKVEAELASKAYFSVPNDKIDSAPIRTGDIICFVSSRPGLDIAHVAIAVEKEGVMKFIHASFQKKAVVLDAGKISGFHSGSIRVARLTF